MGICKLCLQDKVLRRSHIVPEFLYGPIYNEKHQMMGITGRGQKRYEVVQKGIRDRLLCDECEGLLNDQYEKPFKSIWTERYPIPDDAPLGAIVNIKLAYATFRLFQLSILWRASVSSDPNFRVVGLGKHEDILRSMLLRGEVGNAELYPIWGMVIRFQGGLRRQLHVPPWKSRVAGQIVYSMVWDSICWQYGVSCSPVRPDRDGRLQVDGSMSLMVRRPEEFRAIADVGAAWRGE